MRLPHLHKTAALLYNLAASLSGESATGGKLYYGDDKNIH